jgi:hypothetical protein
MNIFVTNADPIVAAQELCDQHCRSKMQIESAILLQHCFDNNTLLSAPPTKKGAPRKAGKGYYNHPCSVWVRESKENFIWLVEHALEMFNERDFRWPQSVAHFTKSFIEWCKENVNKVSACKGNKLTPFAVAINKEMNCRTAVKNFDHLPVTEKYRLYIQLDKPFATWTTRSKPSWY